MSMEPEPRDQAPELLAVVDGWRGAHPLARLRESLLAHQREGKLKRRRDVLAEAMVGRHLLAAGCDVAFEVPTPAGRTCDFRVDGGEQVFYLHVKRLAGRVRDRTLTISSRLRVLEQVRRPCTASIRWRPDADDTAMMRLVSEAERFLLRASIGDELIVREQPGGPEIGGVRIIGPGEGTRVTLVIGLPEGLGDAVPRVRRLMERAEAQFMPRAVNVVLLGGGGAGGPRTRAGSAARLARGTLGRVPAAGTAGGGGTGGRRLLVRLPARRVAGRGMVRLRARTTAVGGAGVPRRSRGGPRDATDHRAIAASPRGRRPIDGRKKEPLSTAERGLRKQWGSSV